MNTYKLLYSHTRTDNVGRKMDEEMEKVSPVKPYSRLRGHLITVIFAIMTIIFITLLVLVPVLYVQLSEDYNNQVITCTNTNILIYKSHTQYT